MEVMGLMLGEFVDDYTVRVIDVFAMPQTGTVNIINIIIKIINININEKINKVHLYNERLSSYVFSGCQCRSGGSSVPGKDVRHAKADWSAGNGGRLVPFSSRIWLLAVRSGYQYSTVLRGS